MADEKPVWEHKIEFAETYMDTQKVTARVSIAAWLDNESTQEWELVSVAPSPPDGALAYYFRRPYKATEQG